jgi:HCOMODA/2-hydroxy-3-carboxy-muconic semialdehyde decarboxylase
MNEINRTQEGAIGRRQFFLAAIAGVLAPWRLSAQDRAALLNDVVAANRILYAQGVVDGFGHVSARTGPNRFLLSRSIAPAQVTAADIVEYDLDAAPVNAGAPAGYLERFIHSEIFRVRPDVTSVVHCHAPSLIPFGITGVPLRPVYHNSSFVGEGVPVFEIRSAAGDATNMLVSTAELGRALARALGSKPAVLMRGHGAVIVGRSVEEAVARSVYLDVNARVQSEAMALGGRITYLSDGEVKQRSGASEYTRAWELWKSQLPPIR